MYKDRNKLFSLTILIISFTFFFFSFSIVYPMEIFGEDSKVFEAQIKFEKPADFNKYRDNLHSEVFDFKLLTNNTDLCTMGNCKFEFIDDNYINGLRFQNNEQLTLTGTLEIYYNNK
ncbi:MAG TPA: hypothetical protein VE595_03705, partial [Nitrososphaeraceae archaeon]|nr:hypothetical protein [Nitrososphaeraceae archaeon]